ncbi:hypothetical protein C7E17_27185, partial [Stenotrophomonas maltophilia]
TGSADDHAFAQWLAWQGWAQVQAGLRNDGASIGLIAAADRFTGSADDHAFAQWLAWQGWAQVQAGLRND